MPDNKIKNVSLGNLSTFAAQMKDKYAKKTDIPTAVSALTNDAKYQTEEQVAATVAAADHLARKKVASLEAIDPAAEGPKTGSDEDDQYDEYMVLDGAVEHVGNTKVDLSGYVRAEDFEEIAEAEIIALFAEE